MSASMKPERLLIYMRQSAIGLTVIWVERDGLLEEVDRLLQVRRGSVAVPMTSEQLKAMEIGIVSGRIAGASRTRASGSD